MAQDKFLNVKYKIESSENFEAHLAKTGLPEDKEKAVASDDTATIMLSKDGDNYTVRSTTKFSDVIINFKDGVEFSNTTPDGKTHKGKVTIDGDKFIHLSSENPEATIIMQFADNKFIVNLKNRSASATFCNF